MPITLDGTNGITTPTYGGADTSEYLVPVTGFKNRIINGNMSIDQRNAGASVTANDGVFGVDRFKCVVSQSSKGTVQQSTTAPAGYINSLLFTSSSAYSIGANDYFNIRHNIEGLNVTDLGWGTANAQTVTLSFWVRSSLTGTFGGAFANSAYNRSYPFSYTISSANTWEQKSITVAGDTSGTWLTTNGIGLVVNFGLGVGSTWSGTAGAWASATYNAPTGATSVVGTNGATFYITGVQLEVGSTATSFDYRPYGTELQLCQRYFQQIKTLSTDGTMAPAGSTTTTSTASFFYPYIVPPRVAATGISVSSAGDYGGVTLGSNNAACSTIVFAGAGTYSVRINATFSGAPFSASFPQPCFLYTINNGYIQFTGMEL